MIRSLSSPMKGFPPVAGFFPTTGVFYSQQVPEDSHTQLSRPSSYGHYTSWNQDDHETNWSHIEHITI